MDRKRRIRLAAFDMDGVLTTVQSSWKYVHDRFGVDNSRNLSRYLRGEINYEQFMISDVDLWLEKMGKVHSDSVKNILGDMEDCRDVPPCTAGLFQMSRCHSGISRPFR